MRHLPALIGLALLAACSSENDEASASDAPATQAAAVAGAAPVAKARKVEISDELMDFDYSYPVQAAAIPALTAMLESDLAEHREELRQEALQEQKDARAGGWETHPFVFSTSWKVVTEIPGWLSLSADRYEFAGGAHGNPYFDALLWDKAANIRRGATSLFISEAALSAAIRTPFCDQIDRQRAEKRGGPVDRADGDIFSECIDPVEQTVILGSSDHQHFDRIGVLVGPYAAGPYVEGTYEATMPVTAAVLKAVKPEYRKYFALKR